MIRTLALLAGAVLLLIVAFVLLESGPALRTIGVGRFLTDAGWHPREGSFNVWPLLLGSLLVTGLAVMLALPAGVIVAIYTHHYASGVMRGVVDRVTALLAAVPSVVFGLWGLVSLVPWIAKLEAPGTSLLAAGIVLALMIYPTIAMMASVAMKHVPRVEYDAARALGLETSTIVRKVTLPHAWPGIASGVVLATARAIGETMAVLMVAGNVVHIPDSIFDPVRTITANIALEMGYATADHRSALFVNGLLLLGVIIVLLVFARVLKRSPHHA